jgi:hypothetical protein
MSVDLCIGFMKLKILNNFCNLCRIQSILYLDVVLFMNFSKGQTMRILSPPFAATLWFEQSDGYTKSEGLVGRALRFKFRTKKV